VVTNAQDFMHILKLYVERELTDRKQSGSRSNFEGTSVIETTRDFCAK